MALGFDEGNAAGVELAVGELLTAADDLVDGAGGVVGRSEDSRAEQAPTVATTRILRFLNFTNILS